MNREGGNEALGRNIYLRAGVPVFAVWLLLPVSFLLPLIDSTRPPYVDLSQTLADTAYWLAQSGGVAGAPLIGLALIVLLVSRPGINRGRRLSEAAIFVFVGVVFAGGGSSVNEHVLKAELKVPRPNVVWLAGNNGSGPLGMTPSEFYQSGDKTARRKPMMAALAQKPVLISPAIEAHWIDETGYSFPSGHAYSAMFVATFFLFLAVTYLSPRRRWIFYCLLPWALAVCYSRPILRVHSPTDITVGGLLGVSLGIVAWALARTMVKGLP